jgi:hypothetical protein
MAMSDKTVMESTVESICEAVVTTIDRSWRLSQHSTLVALARVFSFLAVTHIAEHPQSRDLILHTVRDVGLYIESETAVKQ